MVKYLRLLRTKKLVRFGLVGITSVGIDFVIYNILIFLGDINLITAKALGFLAGSLNSFVLHRSYTFKVLDRPTIRMVTFYAVYLSSLLLNNIINYHSIQNFPDGANEFAIIVAFLIASAASVVWNYLGMKLFVFHRNYQ